MCPKGLSLNHFYSHYILPRSVIQNHPGISFQFYVSNTQLYLHCTHKTVTQASERLKKLLRSANRLSALSNELGLIKCYSKTVCVKVNEFFPVNILGNPLKC